MLLSDFKLETLIGRGGFGKVWRVKHKKSLDTFAMKEISKVKVYEKQSVDCIINERRLLSHLDHKFLVNMHYAFQDYHHLYLVMDFLEGGDLRYNMCNKEKFSEEQVSFFLTRVHCRLALFGT